MSPARRSQSAGLPVSFKVSEHGPAEEPTSLFQLLLALARDPAPSSAPSSAAEAIASTPESTCSPRPPRKPRKRRSRAGKPRVPAPVPPGDPKQ